MATADARSEPSPRWGPRRAATVVPVLVLVVAAVWSRGVRYDLSLPTSAPSSTSLADGGAPPRSAWAAALDTISEQLAAVLPEGSAARDRIIGALDRDAAAAAAAKPAADAARPGLVLRERGLRAKHPVLMLPGLTSSGLELWAGEKCMDGNFRARLWGSVNMVKVVLNNKDCWLKHMEVDGRTGADPPGIAVRAAEGMQASDFFAGNYWLWSRLIENLADIGYTASNLALEPYDWRIPFALLEARDGYLSKVLGSVERLVRASGGEKAVLVGHSMGSNLLQYFMQWVGSPPPHGAGKPPDWFDRHVEAVVFLAGPLLGTPKVVMGMLAGESKEFAQLPGPLGALLDAVASPRQRRRLLRAMPAARTLLPRGGAAVWGSLSAAPDDAPRDAVEAAAAEAAGEASLLGAVIQRRVGEGADARLVADMDMDGALAALAADAVASLSYDASAAADATAADGGAADADGGGAAPMPFSLEDQDLTAGPVAAFGEAPEEAWANPLRTALPHAPAMAAYCLYGTGILTERAYVLTPPPGAPPAPELGSVPGAWGRPGPDAVPLVIDRSVSRPESATNLTSGVHHTDGDGTVHTISAGFMCYTGWRANARRNPAGARTVAREYRHREPTRAEVVASGLRSGPATADHVDILGNEEVNSDLLLIAAGRGNEVVDRVDSRLPEVAARVHANLVAAGEE